MIDTRVKRYEWNDLAWREINEGVFSARISLLPSEYLHIEEGWEIDGPVRVSFRWRPKENITRARYRPLRKSEFDLDDPTEYPCASCGAERKAPCNGEKPECAFRVFFIGGGKL